MMLRISLFSLALPAALVASDAPHGGPAAAHAPEVRAQEAHTPEAAQDDYEPDWQRFEGDAVLDRIARDQMGQEEKLPERGESLGADRVYFRRLSEAQSDEERRAILLEMAEMLELNYRPARRAAVYEKYIETFPDDPAVPEIYLRLGYLYREMGAPSLALAKFYAVLNAALSTADENLSTYRLLSLKAQLEIGDTHFLEGDYKEATRFFDRLQRLDLPESDRAHVDFKLAYCRYLLQDYERAAEGLAAFLETNPSHRLAAEAYFLRANALRRLDRPREAVATTLALLAHEHARSDRDAAIWSYWKKRTGNQLANDFYKQGDFASALRIYQVMATLGADAEWRLPIIYQIGLCYERLRMYPKSRESYEYILNDPDGLLADIPEGERSEDLALIIEFSKWRMQHLQWLGEIETSMNSLLGSAAVSVNQP